MAKDNEGQTQQGDQGQSQETKPVTTQTADSNGQQTSTTQQTSQAQNTGDPNQRGTNTEKQTPAFSYKEDRSKWLPPHRFNEVNTKAQTLESENKRLNDQLKALVGVQPVDPNAEKLEVVKETMFQMFPWAKKFSELSEEQLNRVINAADNVDATQEFIVQGQTKHARTMLNSLVEEVTSMSGDLSDRAQSKLKTAFTSMIEQEVARTEQTGEVTASLQRYIDGDETLIQEFAKEWFEDFGKPIRRQITTQEINRSARVPNSQGRTPVTTLQRPAKFNTLDDRIEFAANLAKERGIQFGG